MSKKTAAKKGTTTTTTTTTSYSAAAAEAFFLRLADPDDPEVINMEGIGKLCELIEIDPTADVRALVLVWKIGALSKPGQITKEEFLQGTRNLNISDVNSFKAYLPALDPGFLERTDFREGTHKTIEKDIIVGLLPIVLDKDRAPHLNYFIDFLQQCNHTRITLDQWESFLQFNHTVKVDLSNFEDDGAWPLLLDEYVDWRKKK